MYVLSPSLMWASEALSDERKRIYIYIYTPAAIVIECVVDHTGNLLKFESSFCAHVVPLIFVVE